MVGRCLCFVRAEYMRLGRIYRVFIERLLCVSFVFKVFGIRKIRSVFILGYFLVGEFIIRSGLYRGASW